jgi:hypothetical protein
MLTLIHANCICCALLIGHITLLVPYSEYTFRSAEQVLIFHTCFWLSFVRDFSITSMKGGYRRVLQRPVDFEWYKISKKSFMFCFME